MKTLKRNEPYDEVHGFDPEGRKYFQDGVYFTAEGNEVGAAPEAKPEAKPEGGASVDDQLKLQAEAEEAERLKLEAEEAERAAQEAKAAAEKAAAEKAAAKAAKATQGK